MLDPQGGMKGIAFQSAFLTQALQQAAASITHADADTCDAVSSLLRLSHCRDVLSLIASYTPAVLPYLPGVSCTLVSCHPAHSGVMLLHQLDETDSACALRVTVEPVEAVVPRDDA